MEMTSTSLEIVLSLMMGLGLAAACGFRVFAPPFIMSLAALSGHLDLSGGFAWMGTPAAAIVFGTALIIEIAGYYVPMVDHFLDTIAGPAAVVAGTVVAASAVADIQPMLKWTLAFIAGGGVAGAVHAVTGLGRGGSTLVTGGLGNPLYATAELGGSVLATLGSIFVPLLTFVVVLLGLGYGLKRFQTYRSRSAVRLSPASS